MLAISEKLLARQCDFHIFGRKAEHLGDFLLELPDGGRGEELDDDGAVDLHASSPVLVLDHVADDDSVEHLTLENRVVRLNITSAFLLTDLDDALEDAD